MIRDIRGEEYEKVLHFIRQDPARNYFILLAFESSTPVFDQIIGDWDENGELQAVLFKRKTGNLQFYSTGDFDVEGFSKLISNMPFKTLISPGSYCDKLLGRDLFSSVKEGAIIAKLVFEDYSFNFESCAEVEDLCIDDLDQVVELYENVFNSFSSKEVMQKRLTSKRGRGVCIRSRGIVISVAQSEFETKGASLIVGVATLPHYQRKGLAEKCVAELCRRLLSEGKTIYLQYDNPSAGRLYDKIGFRAIDQVKHYSKNRLCHFDNL